MTFGPTFGQELAAVGLGPGLSWTADEIFGRETLTLQQNDLLDKVIAAHDPTKTLVPEAISFRQFYQAAAMMGMITQDEALAAARTGEPPAMMKHIIDALPPDQQFAVKMLLASATEFDRSHPLVAQIGHAVGKTDAEIDDFWRMAASL